MLFASSEWFYLSLLIMPLIGFSTMRQMVSANTLIQSVIPDEYRGRIMALYAITRPDFEAARDSKGTKMTTGFTASR